MSSDALHLSSSRGALMEARASQASRELRSPACGDANKVHKSATDFESILLSSWLEKMEQTIQTLPGDEQDPGADNFQSLGVQAISGAIVARGGFGIAKVIEKHLLPACPAEGGHQSNLASGQVGRTDADGETTVQVLKQKTAGIKGF